MKNLFVAIALWMAMPVSGKGIAWRGMWNTCNGKSVVRNLPVVGKVDKPNRVFTLDFVKELEKVTANKSGNTEKSRRNRDTEPDDSIKCADKKYKLR